jgi:rhodanese-related sulfurtransferase
MVHVLKSTKLQQLTPAQVQAEQRRGALILDIRAAEQFASFHIRGALQIGLAGPFASWAALLIEPTQNLLLAAEDATSAHEAESRLSRVGLFQVVGYTLADKTEWEQYGIQLANFSIGWWRDVSCQLEAGEALQLVDVRSRAEWLKGHLPGAISLPLLAINSAASSVDFSKPSLVYCEEGYRATTAASMLLRERIANVGLLFRSEGAWPSSQLSADPLEPSVPGCLCGADDGSTARLRR